MPAGTRPCFPCAPHFIRFPSPTQHAETVRVARLFDTPFIFIYSRQMASGLLTDEAEDEGKIAIGGEFGNAEAPARRVFVMRMKDSGMFCGTTACSAEP